MADFFFMNGYGFYVWGAYGAAFIILDILIIAALMKSKKLRDQHKLLENIDKE